MLRKITLLILLNQSIGLISLMAQDVNLGGLTISLDLGDECLLKEDKKAITVDCVDYSIVWVGLPKLAYQLAGPKVMAEVTNEVYLEKFTILKSADVSFKIYDKLFMGQAFEIKDGNNFYYVISISGEIKSPIAMTIKF